MRLLSINLIDGSSYVVRDDPENIFESKTYSLKKGCIINNTRTPNGQMSMQLLDLSENSFFELPFLIQTSCISKVCLIKKGSELEHLYLKVTSGIIITQQAPQTPNLN